MRPLERSLVQRSGPLKSASIDHQWLLRGQRFVRSFALSSISVCVLLGCSGAKNPGSGLDSAGANNASGGSAGNGGGGSSGGAMSVAAGSANAAGLNLNLDLDSGTSDAGGSKECVHLNIGIFGNPGANASSNFQQWLVKSGTSAQRVQTSADQPLTSATLEPFDVVILDWLTRDYTAAEAAIFATWVSAGGGVASMTGYDNNTTDDWHANSLLAPLQVGYSGSLISGPVMDFATHPITSGLSFMTFNGGYAVSDLGGTQSTRIPLAFLPNTPKVTVGVAVQMGMGRAVVWGDEWIEFDSEWSALPQITQFWVQLFAWLSPTTSCALTPPK